MDLDQFAESTLPFGSNPCATTELEGDTKSDQGEELPHERDHDRSKDIGLVEWLIDAVECFAGSETDTLIPIAYPGKFVPSLLVCSIACSHEISAHTEVTSLIYELVLRIELVLVSLHQWRWKVVQTSGI